MPVVLLALMLVAVPGAVSAQTVAAWFSKASNSAAYATISAETKAMAQQFQALGLSDSILTARLEEAYRKHVTPEILLASLKTDTQRAVQLSSMLRESGLFPSDKKTATSTIEQMLIFMRAGLTEAEMRGALRAGLAKSGKSAKSVSRALAALAAIAAADAQSVMTEQDRLNLASELISSSLSENQFGSMVAAKKASQSFENRASEASAKSSENAKSGTTGSGQAEEGHSESGHGNASGAAEGAQGPQGTSNGQGGQSAGSHNKK